MKVDLTKDSLAMWVVCSAIAEQHELINKMHTPNDGLWDIAFVVNGIELNFVNVINRIDEIHNDMVKKAAGKMYLEEYDRRSDEITEELERIADRLKEIRRRKFPEISWGDDY